jgi:serine/threonine protein kinase
MEQGKLLNGKYQKIKKIGEGSSGKVYLCKQVANPQDENSNQSNSSPYSGKPSQKYYALKKIRLGKGTTP